MLWILVFLFEAPRIYVMNSFSNFSIFQGAFHMFLINSCLRKLTVFPLWPYQVLLLMRNLSVNLLSPEFEEHVSVLCQTLLTLYSGFVQLYAIWEIHSWCSSLTCVAHSLCANGVSLVIRLFFVWNCSFVISIGDQNFYETGFLSRFLLRYDEINKSPPSKNKNKIKEYSCIWI